MLDHALGERHRREARRARQALLARRVHRVDAPLVDFHRRAAERGDRVHDHHRAVLVRDARDLLGVRLAAGRSFGVHEGDDLGVLVLLQRILDLVRIHRLAPFVLDHHRHTAAANDVLEHAAAEHAVDAHDDLVARRHHVDEAVLHPDRARAGDGEGQRVLRLVDVTQERLQFLHHVHEDGVEVADRRLAHGRQHAGVDLRGPRAHERAFRGINVFEIVRVNIHDTSLKYNIMDTINYILIIYNIYFYVSLYYKVKTVYNFIKPKKSYGYDEWILI